MTDTPPGDIAAALDAARDNTEIIDPGLDIAGVAVVARRQDVDVEVVDLTKHLAAPHRSKGTTKALTAEGFIAGITRLVDTDAIVYADIDTCTLVAILNDDEPEGAGWRDHRVTYTPQPTPEWLLWTSNQGLHDQAKFARIIEDGEVDIRNPSATVMLDMAQTFNASSTAKFKQAGRLKDGRTQLVYEEEIDASAGEGMVSIPDVFTVEVRPFYGALPRTVECRLRFRLDRGELKIGYTISRPDEIRRESFLGDVIGAVTTAGLTVLDAIPADPR